MSIIDTLKERIVLFDGGMGSLLQEAGLRAGELPETWNVLRPEIITGIQTDYLKAGADVITTNTFGANRLKYPEDSEFPLRKVVTAALDCAKAAVKQAGHGQIALDLGPTGKLLQPMGELAFEDCVSIFAETVRIGVEAGADLIIIETMSDLYELKAAVLAAKENCDLPVFATTVFDEGGRLLTGGTPENMVAVLEGLGVDALGMNCGLGPIQMKPLVKRIVDAASVPVIVNPNAGLPRTEGKKTVYDIGPEEFVKAMDEILDMGVSVVGGCCGTTPEHIRLLKECAAKHASPEIIPKTKTLVTSYSQAVEIGKSPILVGERINPTGKKKFQQALKDHNIEYILDVGFAQQEKGAHVLDVNVGYPGIDEPEMLVETVQELQAVIDLPLQLDTTNPVAMERALRIYNGKPMINSVNGKQENMDAIFPLVKKYGGVVVALALDEDGIPDTADGRIAVAKKIYAEAAKYGIPAKDIIVDCLCMTISSDPQGALVTLESLRRVRDELHGNTILGVSNISFGLPHREIVNSHFFTMAMQNGLSAAIVNVNSDDMMRSYYAYCALAALDDHCESYINVYSNYVPPVPKGYVQGTVASSAPASNEGTASASESGKKGPGAELVRCVESGLKDQAAKEAEKILEIMDPLDVINSCMVPALDHVGKLFEKGTLFLPQLLMSAEAAQSAFEVIRGRMPADTGSEKKNSIILATVKGDIHDIGKNIVRVLLENYSFDVVDLGRDVPPETVLQTALEKDIKLVGLSALMTTTVPSMEETIALLREKAPDVKVMVGGAVLTEEYAAEIGADAYCKDAMASVNYAQKVFETA
ncbi:MAG: homocysteine S-methyltransferase family protein [Lachnospiraceae bacterium]|nr:homocysteine S-methyltransferase family protein [Lachnospiraceae bacterium]